METTGALTPANAENTAPVEAVELDGETVETKGDGSAPSVPEADTPAKVKKDPVQERFDKLTRDKYDALREADRRGYELERLNARLVELEKAQKPEVATQTDFPTLEQFGYDEGKFHAAVATYTRGMTESAKAAAREAAQEIVRAEREASQQQESLRNWAKKEAEFIKSKPDYVEKVLEARTLPISREIQMELRESELGPQIAYYLVENPDKAAAILQLPLKAQLKEIGRIEARLESTKTPAKPAVSQAPPPVSKVDASDAVVEKDPSTMSDAEFAKWRKRQIAQRR
jgi:hypothetical protein